MRLKFKKIILTLLVLAQALSFNSSAFVTKEVSTDILNKSSNFSDSNSVKNVIKVVENLTSQTQILVNSESVKSCAQGSFSVLDTNINLLQSQKTYTALFGVSGCSLKLAIQKPANEIKVATLLQPKITVSLVGSYIENKNTITPKSAGSESQILVQIENLQKLVKKTYVEVNLSTNRIELDSKFKISINALKQFEILRC